MHIRLIISHRTVRVQFSVQSFVRHRFLSAYQSTKLEPWNFWLDYFCVNFAQTKPAMEKDSEIRERMREKAPLIMGIVLGVALVLAIVVIVCLLKLSFT